MMNGFTPQFQIVENPNPTSRIYGVLQGQFILDGNIIFLQTLDGDRFSLDRVDILSTAFNDKDGILRFPRPFVYDKFGNVVDKGDLVIIAFYKGDVFNPIVIGSVIPIQKDEFFHNFTQADYQKKKTRFETEGATIEYQDDGNGEIQLDITAQGEGTGNITINLTGSSDNGNIIINTNGNVQLTAQKDVTIESSQVINIQAADQVNISGDSKVVVDSPAIELGENAVEYLVKGTSLLSWLNSHIHQVGAAPGPSLVPTVLATSSILSSRNKTL